MKIPVISLEQQFAEKLHSCTLERDNPNSRVKDIVDLVLLIKQVSMSRDKLIALARATFTKRDTHSFPPVLEIPPESRQSRYPSIAESCGIGETLQQAFELIKSFCESTGLIQ